MDLSGLARWIDNISLDLESNQNLSGGTAAATAFGEPCPERDDALRMEVHVQHEVRVEHCPV